MCGKEEIVRVAVGIVDEEGMEALSVRRVAKELGVSSMTIYNYVENLKDIKKKVLMSGFDRLYECIYRAVNSLKPPASGRVLCKTIAMELFSFAGENRKIFMFMFSDGRSLFHEDAEVRPFYSLISKLTKRAKATQDGWLANEKGYKLFEIMVYSIAYQYSAGTLELTVDELSDYIDYYLDKCIES